MPRDERIDCKGWRSGIRRACGAWVCLALMIFCAAFEARAARVVVYDNASSAGVFDNLPITTLSWTHTVGGGFNRVIVVGVSTSTASPTVIPDQRVLNVTYGGVQMTRIGTRLAPDNRSAVEMFQLIAPAPGQAAVNVTFSAPLINYAVGGAVSFTDAHQCMPTGPFAANDSSNCNPPNCDPFINVPSATNELVLDTVATTPEALFLVPAAGQTQRWTGTPFFNFQQSIGAGSTKAGAPLVQMSWMQSAASPWAVGGVSLAPAPVIETGDFNADNKADFAVWRPADGNWFVQDSANNALNLKQWGAATDVPVPGDYDGDGKTDIAVYRPSEGNWYIVQSSTGAIKLQGWGASTDRPVPADYDGDGRTDIAVFRPSEGNWYIIKSNGGVIVQGWGASDDKLVPGDYDGDGHADIAVWRPSEGNWYVIQSATNTAIVKNWGQPGDRPVPGDYDGDGRTDFAVFRPSEGGWYTLESCHNTGTVRSWGLGTDKLVPADYDGDGKTDIAVWRATEGNWYIIQSATNTVALGHLGQSGDVPIPSTYIPQ